MRRDSSGQPSTDSHRRELAHRDLARQRRRSGLALRHAAARRDRADRAGQASARHDLDLDPAAAGRIEAGPDQASPRRCGPIRLIRGRKTRSMKSNGGAWHIVGAALEHEPRRRRPQASAAAARSEGPAWCCPRCRPRSDSRRALTAPGWKVERRSADRQLLAFRRRRSRRRPRPRSDAGASARARSRPPRIFSIRNGWPVTSDKAQRVAQHLPAAFALRSVDDDHV